MWAADLFAVQTVILQTLYACFLISQRCRRPAHFDVTAPPDRRLVWRQMFEATSWGQYAQFDRSSARATRSRTRMWESGASPGLEWLVNGFDRWIIERARVRTVGSPNREPDG